MKKILIVNNDPDTLELLEQLLHLRGYEIKINDDPKEVPEVMKSFDPDLILVDMSRQEVVELVKSHASNTGVPVLLMTGHNTYHYDESGVQGIIEKPFTMDSLEKSIARIWATSKY